MLRTTGGWVNLPAPLLGIYHWDQDFAYSRKLAGLYQELLPLPPPRQSAEPGIDT